MSNFFVTVPPATLEKIPYFLGSFTPRIVLRNAHTLRDGFLIRDAVIERRITYRITQFLDLFLSGQVEDCTRFEHGKEGIAPETRPFMVATSSTTS